MTIESIASQSYSFTADLLRTVAGRIDAATTRRAQRIALVDLLSMGPHLLDDLGIDQHDIIEALKSPPPAGPRLEARRAARAACAD